ncbi:MAG: nuclear transport factor 2 family protein [Myxococcota bacterium]
MLLQISLFHLKSQNSWPLEPGLGQRRLADRLALRELACRYARAIDRRDWALARELFTEDSVLVAPHFVISGADAIVRGFRVVERYRSTFHAVLNQLFEVAGDEANGETYCVASHLFDRDGRAMKLDWGIRYQDHCRRTEDGWRFARRELLVDWEQELPVL